MKKKLEYSGIKVLILEGYSRQSLPLIRAFRKLGCNVTVLCAGKLDVAYASRLPHKKIIGICDRTNLEGTANQVLDLIKGKEYALVVPTTDFSAELLSKNKEKFKEYTYVASNDLDVFNIASDKLQTMAKCTELDIPSPKTYYDVKSLSDILKKDITFPMVVKPRKSYGAIGFKVVNSVEELKATCKEESDISRLIFQEYIPQTDIQYECAMFVDNNNEVKTSVVFSKNRWYPVNGGSSTLNITVKRPDIVESCTKLLTSINWRGPADIDLIQDERDGKAKIMEINPRVSGSVKIVFESGVDQARQMLETALNKDVTKYSQYKTGIRLRCFQTDLLWFIKSKNRFKAKPCWFSIKKTKDQIFYLDDPLPFFAFTIRGLFNYKKEMKKRS